ncbi:MAG: serine--tRNA ligase [Candidatus Dojkabacteria bacterium]|nr:MAG: serine--tRNA ligase [Candidatus Dojkabacteria bacterium]
MLDLHYVLTNPQKVKDAISSKGVRGISSSDVDTIITLANEQRALVTETQGLRTRRNEIADTIQKAETPEEKQKLIAEGKALKETLQTKEAALTTVEADLFKLMSYVPNVPSDDTPIGKDENDNVEIRTVGEKPTFDFPVKNHVELLTGMDLADFERGTKVSGFRGYYLKGDLAMLHYGALMYAFQKLVAKGYTPVIPPALVKSFTLFGSGHHPWSGADVYEAGRPDIDETGKEGEVVSLAATAEIPLMGMYANEVLDGSQLPLKMVGLSPCYRREIGSYSKDVKGFYRVHEFMKIEQVILCHADSKEAEEMLQELMRNSEEIMQDFKLHYRVLAMCTGDMGEPQYKKYDIETWMPGKGGYGETHSASNMSDFQCRRNNIRYTNKDGERIVAYSLNNTALASPRFLVALVENNQTAEGHIKVPEVLQPFLGKDLIKASSAP